MPGFLCYALDNSNINITFVHTLTDLTEIEMATYAKGGGKRIDRAKDAPIKHRIENGVKIFDLGTMTFMDFLRFSANRRQTQSAYINNVFYYLRYGDAKTEKQFEEYRANHRLNIETASIGDLYSHSGDYVDVGRYMSGEPECMVDYVSDEPVKFLTIRLRVAATNGDYFAYYANICDLVDYLESKGTRCRIVAQMNHGNWESTDGRVQALADVIVKDYSEPFNLSVFCAVFFHIEFSRIIYTCAISISGCTDVVGIDSLYNRHNGNPENFQQSPDTTEWIVFPSLWFDDYNERYGYIFPYAFFDQIGISHLIE